MDAPDDVHGNFYRGKVFVTCKDKVTQQSSAFRHVTELMSIVTTYFSTDGLESNNPIIVLVTDGGPDHRLTFALVKISLLVLFLGLNLDMLVAVRTCMSLSELDKFSGEGNVHLKFSTSERITCSKEDVR